MVATLSPLRRAMVFYLLALGGVTTAAITGASTSVAMLTPAIAAVLMLLVVTREGWSRHGWATLGLHRAGFRSWPVAVVVPLLIVALGAVVVASTSRAHWETSGQAAGFSPAIWLGIVLINIAYASLSMSLTEEIGWRGYFLPRLSELGERKALLASGLLHGLWHVPVMLLTTLYHPAGNRFIVLTVFLVTVTAVGVFLGWLRLRTDSVWPPVLAHSANNVGIMWLGDLVVGDAVAIQYIADEGFVHLLAYLVIAAAILLRANGARPNHSSTAAPAASRPTVSI
jgi:membrane protease YdiL (CAAX protease family)